MSAQASTSDLPAAYAVERAAIDAALERACEAIVADAPPGLAGAIRYALEAKGKRLRPILCVAAYRAAKRGPEHEAIYDVAAAIELLHTYSLVHDDLPCMDDDDLRRGRPTTHRVFGVAPAAVAGAALIPHACACLDLAGRALALDAAERALVVRELA
ncbi:MAG: polyprenyl synthetase family protein, partial [Longimicrobiales bacterium]